ncbi:MAG TPA: S24 family peptidase [Allosphingosinicella sp.]|jgi:phage repressor protein C with HTH and peptisase S24 domain
MDEAGARAALARLIEEQGADYAGLSRMLGRNPAYIQQYIKRGTPRRLAEEDRRLLARYFGIEEEALGAPERGPLAPDRGGLVRVARLEVGAAAGAGALAGGERARGHIAFDPAWLRRLAADPKRLSLIRVEGDSMAPTLADGDEIMVDRGDAGDRLRDGIYVLRIEDALVVKRVAPHPAGRAISIRSDNPAYPSWPDCDPAGVEIVGRVVWVGRRIG